MNHVFDHLTSRFSFSLSTVAVAIALAHTPLAAQSPAPAEQQLNDGKLERIEVTARRTVESLQEVPVAITSVGEQELAEQGVAVLTEVQQYSPNTTLQTSRGTNSTLTAFIRGVGQQDPLWGYEPGVGIYVDDVYIARPQGAVLDLLDVQRIEVLRGPQGTLYGKNTIGGAIKYVTKPMAGAATFNAQATVGNYSRTDFKLTGQLPIIDETLYIGFGVADLSRDGYGNFLQSALPNQDRENYNKDLTAARLTVEYTPNDDLFFRFAWDKTEDDSNAKGGYRLLPSLLTDAPVPSSVFDSYTSLPTFNKVEIEGYSLTASYQVNDQLQLKYIGSSRENYSPTNIDFDNTALDIFDVPAEYDDENTTHELQANLSGARFELVSGLYYYDGTSCGNFNAILGVLGRTAFATPGLTREVTGCNLSESTALYGEASFALSQQWSMSIGARYTEEEKRAIVRNGLIFDNVYPYSGWIPGYVRPEGDLVPVVLGADSDNDGVLDSPKSETFSRFTPRVTLEYQASADTMLFAGFAQGFKSGTFNPRATINEPAVEPEIVDSFELGVKSDLSDAFRANVTLFMLDHQDRQYISVLPGESATDLQQILGNVGTSEATGVEAELTYVATDNLSLEAAIGLIDAEFDEVIEATENGNVDISDRFSISNTPEYTMNLAANYNFEAANGYWVLTANYYYRDDYSLFEQDNLLNQDGYGLLNLGINYEHNGGNWYAGIHAKNVTDEEYLVGGYQFVTPDPSDPTDVSLYTPGLGGDNTLIGYYGDPSTISLTVGYRF